MTLWAEAKEKPGAVTPGREDKEKNMKNLEIFEFQYNNIRILTEDGEPLFVLADLCSALDIANTRNVTSRLDAEVKGVRTVDTPGGAQRMAVVTEAGMYEVIFMSRKPEAKQFKRWITSVVLPEIRKTGSFQQPKSLAERSLELVAELNEEVQRQAAQLDAQRPLVAQATTYQGGTNNTARQAFSREIITWAVEQGFEVKQQQVFMFLAKKLGLFVRGERSDAGEATVDAIRRGLAVTEKGTSSTGHNYATGKLTPKGKAFAWDRIVRFLEQNGSLMLEEVMA